MAYTALTDRVGVIPGGVNVGVVRGEGSRYVLIDAGLNETSGKKAVKVVREELGGEVAAIVTTHGHADHFGANATVVKRTGAKVWAPQVDEAFLRYPILQPAMLFAGGNPPASMRGGFMLADPSPVDAVYAAGPIEVEGVTLDVIPLAGHSPNQQGILIDGVFFCADVVLPESVLEKYKIPYLFAVGDHRDSLDRAGDVNCTHVVPGHGPLLDSILPLRDLNRRLLDEVAELCVGFCDIAVTAEDVLERLLSHYGADPADPPAYYLLHPTAYAFLSHLEGEGRVGQEIRGGRAWWQAAG